MPQDKDGDELRKKQIQIPEEKEKPESITLKDVETTQLLEDIPPDTAEEVQPSPEEVKPQIIEKLQEGRKSKQKKPKDFEVSVEVAGTIGDVEKPTENTEEDITKSDESREIKKKKKLKKKPQTTEEFPEIVENIPDISDKELPDKPLKERETEDALDMKETDDKTANKVVKKKRKIKSVEAYKEEVPAEQPEKLEAVQPTEEPVPEKPATGESKDKKKIKPKLMKLEQVEIKPTKVKVVDVSNVEEFPLFAQIKLKKAKIIGKKEIKSVELPKILLRSHIKHIHYPPEEIKCIITTLNVKPEHGILSRNTQEALKLQRKKTRKIKLPGKEETELEESQFEVEETEKPTKEEEDVKSSWEKLPKKPELEEDEAHKLVIGKGNLPQTEQPEEKVKLKKIPEKLQEPEEKEKQKPKKHEPADGKSKKEKQEISPQLQPVEDINFEREEPVKPYPMPEVPKQLEEELPETEKLKKTRPKKPKKEPEVIQIPLEKGKPKEPQLEEDKDISLKKKMGEPKKEKPEAITLKPFTKEKPPDEEDKTELVIGKPKPIDAKEGDRKSVV